MDDRARLDRASPWAGGGRAVRRLLRLDPLATLPRGRGDRAVRAREVSGPGRVAVEGTVDAVGAESDQSAEESVFRARHTERWEKRGRASSWRTRDIGVEGEPFALADGDESVRVEPPEQRRTGHSTLRWHLLSRTEGVLLDGVLAEFEEFEPEFESRDRRAKLTRYQSSGKGTDDGDVRRAEAGLEPGDEALIVGQAGEGEAADVVEASDSGPFVVAGLDRSELLLRGRLRVARGMLVALLAGAATVWVLQLDLGPVVLT